MSDCDHYLEHDDNGTIICRKCGYGLNNAVGAGISLPPKQLNKAPTKPFKLSKKDRERILKDLEEIQEILDRLKGGVL